MEEDCGRGIACHSNHPKVAITKLVPVGRTVCQKNSLVQEESGEFVPPPKDIDYRKLTEHSLGSMPLLDENLKTQGFSKSDIKFLRKAWRPSTKKTYSNYLKQWVQFCEHFGVDPREPKPNQVGKFLILLSKQGSAYSTVNIARCAISAVTHVDNFNSIGCNRYVSMTVAAAGNVNPPEPRYSSTWRVADVFKVFKRWGRNSTLKFKWLTWKLTVLLLLCTAQRGQTIWLLPLSGMRETEQGVVFRMKHQLKHNKPGEPLSVIRLAKFSQDTRLCPVQCLKRYVERTKDMRGEIDQLLISTVKPYRAVGRETVSNWVKKMLGMAGVDTGKYKAHSTRSAATSDVTRKGINLNALLKVASWKSTDTFAKFYDKPLEDDSEVMTNMLLNKK